MCWEHKKTLCSIQEVVIVTLQEQQYSRLDTFPPSFMSNDISCRFLLLLFFFLGRRGGGLGRRIGNSGDTHRPGHLDGGRGEDDRLSELHHNFT